MLLTICATKTKLLLCYDSEQKYFIPRQEVIIITGTSISAVAKKLRRSIGWIWSARYANRKPIYPPLQNQLQKLD